MTHTEVHQGRNVKRIREILRIKQEVLADGLNVSQQTVSLIEGREVIESEMLEQIAKILNVPVEAINNFNEEKAVNIIATTFTNTNHDQSAFIQHNHNPTFNPLDKIVELYERVITEKDAEINRLREELSKGKPKK